VARLLTERGVQFEFVLDECGAVADELLPGIDRPIGLIGVGEKGYANVEISAEGEGSFKGKPRT
jgi:carboxypeptidase PM20D1